MRRKSACFILGLILFFVSPSSITSILMTNGEYTSWTVKASNIVTYVPVPFHYQQNNYYCGPAALEMVFDYYGEDILQTEIADVARTYPYVTYTDELLRAVHFSNLSTSLGDEMPGNTTGYSAREIGYAAFEYWGLTIDDLKTLIENGEPIIILMWFTPSKIYGHYRVVVGYNETHIIMHDPWNKGLWGGTYGGANTSMTHSTFLELWEYSGYWGLLARPWVIEVSTPSMVNRGDDFEVGANITYPCPPPFDPSDYQALFCNASIELLRGLDLQLGETAQHSLGNISAGNSVQTSWAVHASQQSFCNMSVVVMGTTEGSVWSHGAYSAYDYIDAIGGLSTGSLFVTNQTFRVHNLDTGLNYTAIQKAINANETLNGHTIFVEEGTYYETIVINKSISLIGENRDTTIIDGHGHGILIDIFNVSSVAINGFTLRDCLWGIRLTLSNETTISNNIMENCSDGGIRSVASGKSSIAFNTIRNNFFGTMLTEASGTSLSLGNKIEHNNLINNSQALSMPGADNSTVLYNNIENFYDGITLGGKNNLIAKNNITNGENGISLYSASDNTIIGNTIRNSIFSGIYIAESMNNAFINNNIENNMRGIFLDESSENLIFYNNFINNTFQTVHIYWQPETSRSINTWDNGYPSGGNYWCNYNGTDSDYNGIGDNWYEIDENNTDHYPLMGMFNDFNVTSKHNVQTICNSSILGFQFNSTAISFNVTGENGTAGFCRICIPTALMNDAFRVYVNETEIPHTPLTGISNDTHNYLYFTYSHSTQEVIIIPEFPSFIILPLFMTATLVASLLYRKRKCKIKFE
ncbi:MAG: hypothetical protein AM326_05060 [Candidatus Thorarchaeota archaeon SMTZ-45]|nr:MAG: hypothetical protein AM326_05060 [Candidatus Thorarchaeota archaeon SMTZ-45]